MGLIPGQRTEIPHAAQCGQKKKKKKKRSLTGCSKILHLQELIHFRIETEVGPGLSTQILLSNPCSSVYDLCGLRQVTYHLCFCICKMGIVVATHRVVTEIK